MPAGAAPICLSYRAPKFHFVVPLPAVHGRRAPFAINASVAIRIDVALVLYRIAGALGVTVPEFLQTVETLQVKR